MQLVVLSDTHIRLETATGDEGLSVAGGPFGALQMLAASFALCTASVIHSYAETAQLDVQGLAVEVAWDYAEDPHRVGHYQLTLHLPSTVPPTRHRAILRAADTCAVHQTLSHSPAIETAVQTFEPDHPPHTHVEHHHDHEA